MTGFTLVLQVQLWPPALMVRFTPQVDLESTVDLYVEDTVEHTADTEGLIVDLAARRKLGYGS